MRTKLSERPFPFRQLDWNKLAIMAVIELYLIFSVWSIANRGLFEYVGIDYRVIRSSAEIASSLGFTEVYDLSVQGQYQRPLYEGYSFGSGSGRMRFDTVPMPYLPSFVALFEPLLLLDPLGGFIAWTTLNGIVLALYLQRFLRALDAYSPKLLIRLMLSFPAFATLFFGQVNVLLLVCLGEFMLANDRRQNLRAGMWLFGLLIKPQTLIILLPALLISRRFRALAGFALTGLVVFLSSFYLVGFAGMVKLMNLILLYPGGLPTTFPESMMNWRALAINFAPTISPTVAWWVAFAGIGLTAIAAFNLWVRPVSSQPDHAVIVLGTYAATAAVSWHSHVHMALPLVLPLVYLTVRGQMPRWLLNVWLLVPPMIFTMAAFSTGPGLAHNIVGLIMLALNLTLLGWSCKTARCAAPRIDASAAARTIPS